MPPHRKTGYSAIPTTSLRHPRTLQEAFGPYAEWKNPRQITGRKIATYLAALVPVVALIAIWWMAAQ